MGIDAFGSSEEEVGSDAFDHSSDSEFSWEGRAHSMQAWLSPGNYDVLDRLLFAFINPPIPVADVNPTLRTALATVEPLMPVEFLPSTRGAMIFRCADVHARNTLRQHSPIWVDGAEISWQRPDECSHRFFRVPRWLAFVHVDDFPKEHRYKDKIKASFGVFCEVIEINESTLAEDYYGPLKLLLEVNEHLVIPSQISVSARRGRG